MTLLLSLCACLLMGSATAAPVNQKILASFKREFSKATEETWKTVDGFEVVSFRMESKYLTAYYQESGELKAVTRNISMDQLPLSLQNSIRSNYKDYWITDLFQITSNDETRYFISIENVDQKIILNSIDSLEWIPVERQDKD